VLVKRIKCLFLGHDWKYCGHLTVEEVLEYRRTTLLFKEPDFINLNPTAEELKQQWDDLYRRAWEHYHYCQCLRCGKIER
jgi:hypothetical protein